MKKSNLLADLFAAYYDARKNKRNTVNQLRFEIDMEHNLYSLFEEIKRRTYLPKKSIAFVVSSHIKREVFAADFSDRVVHHLFFNYVNPIFERTFIDDCYSCRKGKGTHYAIKRVNKHVRSCSNNYKQPCFVLKLDLQGYFMSINKKILYKKVESTLNKFAHRFDENGVRWKDRIDYDLVLYLARVIIFNDPTKNYSLKGRKSDWDGLPPSKSLFYAKNNCGLPIGNLTSQLFSNVYMADFDNYVKRKLEVKYYGRYVDDFYLMDSNKYSLKNSIPLIKAYLADNLGLSLHPRKIYLQSYDKGVLFTGGFIKPHRIYVGNRVKSNMNKKLAELKKEKTTDVEVLRSILNSYLGIMKHHKSFFVRQKIMKSHSWVFKYGFVCHCCTIFKLNRDSKYFVSQNTSLEKCVA